MKKVVIPAVIVAIAVIGGLVLLKPGSPSRSPAPAKETAMAPANAAGELAVQMEAGSFYYKPNVMSAKKGQKVKITFHSVSMMHNFNIDELGIRSPMVRNGDTATFEFTPDRIGSFEYYCSVGQHRQLGQVGTLTVQ